MGLYADLQQEDKDIVEPWERNQRGWFNQLFGLLQNARALQSMIDASGGPRAIVTALDAGEEIPNTSGMAGGHPMTKAEWATLIGLMDDFLVAHDTPAVRQLIAKAIGVNSFR